MTPPPASPAAPSLWDRVIQDPRPRLLVAVLVIQALLSVYSALVTLQDFPKSSDEYCYLFNAELYSQGKLFVPSPHPRDFFSPVHMVNNGRFYGKYPPGWPLLLVPGVLAGVPWLVNPLLGAAALAAIYVLAKRHFSVAAANIAMISALANPFLIFNSASYLSHTSCLLFLTLAIHFTLEALAAPDRERSWLLAGVSSGAAFLIRPFTTVVVLAVVAAYVAWQTRRTWRDPSFARGRALLVLCGSVFLMIFFAYNHATTGHPLTQPFETYDSSDRPEIARTLQEFGPRLHSHVVYRLIDLMMWLPLSPVLLVAYLAVREAREIRPGLLLAGIFGAVFVAYFFYWGWSTTMYGPRYLHETTGALLVLGAVVIARYRVGGPFLLACIVLANLASFAFHTRYYAAEVKEQMKVYTIAKERGLKDAIVFLRTGSGTMPAHDLPRNGTTFDGPVLFVRDLGSRNREMLEAYPRRTAWVYAYDPDRSEGTILPYEEARSP